MIRRIEEDVCSGSLYIDVLCFCFYVVWFYLEILREKKTCMFNKLLRVRASVTESFLL